MSKINKFDTWFHVIASTRTSNSGRNLEKDQVHLGPPSAGGEMDKEEAEWVTGVRGHPVSTYSSIDKTIICEKYEI